MTTSAFGARPQSPSANVASSGHIGLHDDAGIASFGTKKERSLRIKVTTFNINGAELPEDTGDLINDQQHTESQQLPDVYIFCFQEAMKLSASRIIKDLVSNSNREEHCEHLSSAIEKALPSGYVNVHSEEMVGLYITIYVCDSLKSQMQYAQSAVVARGPMGLGNKGACAIRFRISDTTIVCVNSHLAASEDELQTRNDDCEAITEWLVFPAPSEDTGSSRFIKRVTRKGLFAGHVRDLEAPTDPADLLVPESDRSDSPQGRPQFNIFDSDYLFFCGDLNYRIALDHDEVLAAIQREDFDFLLKHDQLSVERNSGHMFKHFEEGQIRFRPTYKFDKTTDPKRPYDSSKKRRTPSYTDRILYKQRDESCQVELIEYRSHEHILCSDHLPVSATVDILY